MIEFFKTGSIAPDATAPGLSQARECLRIDTLSSAEKNDYVRHMEAIRYQRSVLDTSRDEGFAEGKAEGRAEGRAEGIDEGKKEEKIAIAKKMLSLNLPTSQIMQITGLTEEEINNLT